MSWEHEIIDTIDLTEHFQAEIRHDDFPLNPREDFDPMGRIVYFKRGAVQEERTLEILPRYALDGRYSIVHLARYLRIFHGAEVALIRGYVHSGTALTVVPFRNEEPRFGGQFGDRWDSMWWGLIFVTRDDLQREYLDHGYTLEEARETAQEVMKSEVDELESWVNGSVYCYTLVAKDGGIAQDILDDTWEGSCGGFFGYDHEKSGLIESAKEEANYFEKDFEEQVADDVLEEAAMRHSELGMVAA